MALRRMINEGLAVLTAPSVAKFEEFERNGTARDGLAYVALAALFSAGLTFLFKLLTLHPLAAVLAALIAFLSPLVGYLAFAYLVYFIGRSQGGTGTQDEVFYTLSLYTAPLLALSAILGAIPYLQCLIWPVTLLLTLYQIYLTYLAVRAAMNLESTPTIITIVIAWIVEIVILAVLSVILGGMYAILHLATR